MAMGRLNNVWDQLFPVERHRIANLMIERIDLVHVGEGAGHQGEVAGGSAGTRSSVSLPNSIGAELLEVEA